MQNRLHHIDFDEAGFRWFWPGVKVEVKGIILYIAINKWAGGKCGGLLKPAHGPASETADQVPPAEPFFEY